MMHPWKRLCGSNHISRFPGFVRKLSSGSASPHQHCVDLVKLHDFDSYVAGLLLPKASRSAYFAIKAFNVEIAMIKDHTHGNAMAGRIRFQWWRDLLESLYRGEGGGGAPGPASMVSASPVGRALYDAVRRHDLSERWFQRSLDARYVQTLPYLPTLSWPRVLELRRMPLTSHPFLVRCFTQCQEYSRVYFPR